MVITLNGTVNYEIMEHFITVIDLFIFIISRRENLKLMLPNVSRALKVMNQVFCKTLGRKRETPIFSVSHPLSHLFFNKTS